jgi:uncharacterized membrane protein YgcG
VSRLRVPAVALTGCLWLAGLLFVTPAAAKSYHYPEIRTRFTLGRDGVVRVEQYRTYRFDGSFSWAYVDLRKQGADDIRWNRLAELTPDGWRALVPAELSDGGYSLRVRWSFSAADEERTFLLDYWLVGAVRRHADCAEFYWKAIEDEHERVRRSVIEIVPPGPSPDLFKLFVHSRARPGTLDFDSARSLATVTQEDIPRNSFVEVRALLDAGLFAELPASGVPAYARILAEERRNYVVTSLLPVLLLVLAGLLLLVLPLALLIRAYLLHGREPKLDYSAIYEHEPPRPAPPAVVPLITVQQPDKSSSAQALLTSLLGNLLALAQRGAVRVAEVREGSKSRYVFRLERPEVAQAGDAFDRQAVDFFFGHVGGGGAEFDDQALKKYGRDHVAEARAAVGEVFDAGMEWWRQVLGSDLVEPTSSRAHLRFLLAAVLSTLGGGIALGAALGMLGVGSGRGGVALGLVGGALAFFACVAAGLAIRRWTPAAYLEHRRWGRFRKFLRDFSAIERAPLNLLAIWEQYYVYAVALGVAEEFIGHVVRLAEARGSDLALPAWYAGAAVSSGPSVASLGSGLAGFSTFASNLSGMVAAFSTATSSGGGFSGGGGGGGGGGSSGAG